MRAHKEPLRCKVCYMEFRMKSKLRNHELLHIYPDPQTCSLPNCGLVFRTETELEQHEKSHQQRFKVIYLKQVSLAKNCREINFSMNFSVRYLWETSGFRKIYERTQSYVSLRRQRIYVRHLWKSV